MQPCVTLLFPPSHLQDPLDVEKWVAETLALVELERQAEVDQAQVGRAQTTFGGLRVSLDASLSSPISLSVSISILE